MLKQRQVTIGRKDFANISAVEGIVLSRRLAADLERTAHLSPARRRAILAAKYGKQ